MVWWWWYGDGGGGGGGVCVGGGVVFTAFLLLVILYNIIYSIWTLTDNRIYWSPSAPPPLPLQKHLSGVHPLLKYARIRLLVMMTGGPPARADRG